MKKLKQIALLWLAPALGFLITHLLAWSCKRRYVISEKLPKNRAILIAFWHGELLMQPFLYRKIRAIPNISVMISDHFDGEIIARLIGFFGFKTIRGSSTRGAKRVLLNAIRELQNGTDVAITPDGPRGPYHSIADGIVLLAQKTDAPIIVFEAVFENAWRLRSWDKFAIPKPFSTITLIAHDPFYLHNLTLEQSKELIAEKMDCTPKNRRKNAQGEES